MTTSGFPAALHAELDSGLAALGLDPALASPLLAYLALLDRWNRTYNLTAIRDPQAMVGKHLLDSLAMHPYVHTGSLADLGTGAGLPGIPLAIAKPGLQVTLVESNGKKARFLREAVRTLGLDNARVAESRAEALDESGAYDAITARALATLPLIIELGGHLLKADGRLLAMKGAFPDDEIAALPVGWRVEAVHPVTVPGLAAERHLVVIARD
jgi:16S rRNA (guanine527-N7)-methyltransferase